MKLADRILLSFSRISLPAFSREFDIVLRYSGEQKSSTYWLGIANIVALLNFCLFTFGSYITELNSVQQTYVLIGSLGGLIFIPIGFYAFFYLKSESRSNEVDKSLPNVLTLIASNLRAGMTPYDATRLAGIPEFGVIGLEIQRATSLSSGNSNFTDSLKEMASRVRSAALERTVRLFIASMKSGSKMASLLNDLAEDISQRQALKNDLMTNIKTNAMFIMFIIIVGTPSLLAVSIYFVDTVVGIQSQSSQVTADVEFAGFGGQISISADFLTQISYIMIFVTGLFACFFLGAITDGDIRKGLRYAPIVIVASYIIFFIARYFIDLML